MPTKNPPITWNQRLNAWDGETLNAFQERLVSSRIIHAELAQLFADTMRWGRTHPFEPRHLDTIVNCWTMMALGSDIPWGQYDEAYGRYFLATIVESAPQEMLDYLNPRVHARLRDRELSVAWMAMALHAACHVDADKASGVLLALAKTWAGDIRRSPVFAQTLGRHAALFPWTSMQALHQKFHAYPPIQKALLQWDGVCTAERLFRADKECEPGDPFWAYELFNDPKDVTDFHAHTLALNIAGSHLHARWGLKPSSALDPRSYAPDAITKDVQTAIEESRAILENVLTEPSSEPPSRAMLQAAARWCFEPSLHATAFQFTVHEADLLGAMTEFRQALHNRINQCIADSQISMELMQLLARLDPPLALDCSELVASGAKTYLLDFEQHQANAIVAREDLPFLASRLRAQDLEELALSPHKYEQWLFWRLLSNPDWLNANTIAQAVHQPNVRRALLLASIVEADGVEHWGVHQDHDHVWLAALSRWYPDHAPLWESAQRETLRSTAFHGAPMLDAVFQAQGLSRRDWSMLSQLVDAPAVFSQVEAVIHQRLFSTVRPLSIGMPQVAQELAWVVDTLHGLPGKDGVPALCAVDIGPMIGFE